MITHTDERIRKLLAKGSSCESIARKIGRPGDVARVHRIGCSADGTLEISPRFCEPVCDCKRLNLDFIPAEHRCDVHCGCRCHEGIP